MSYQVELTRSAARELRRVPTPYHDAIVRVLQSFTSDPRPTGCKKLVGGSGYWRVRVGSYRIVYDIQETIRVVRVERVAHRKDAYR